VFDQLVNTKSAVDTYLCKETTLFLAHEASLLSLFFEVSSSFLQYQAEERKEKREERTTRRIKLLDITAGREAGEKEQMTKHSMPVTNASKTGLRGQGKWVGQQMLK